MREDRNTLERELDRLSPPRISLDQLARRRDRKRRDQRIRAGLLGVAIAIAIVGGAVSIGAMRSTSPAPVEHPTSTATPTPSIAFRREGEFIVFAPSTTGSGWDLAAQDPETGEVRTIVETDGIVDCARAGRCTNLIRKAEWSADGSWVAFEVSNASLDGPSLGPCAPTVGIWVQGPNGVPRQVTTPCEAPPSGSDQPVEELWGWSPVGARLAYARIDGDDDELVVIDPSDGSRTSLVTGSIDPLYPVASSLAWSPDGSRIAYARKGSVYAVDVDGGERSLLADAFEDIIGIAWSPDATRILVQDQTRYRIQVMNADGSDLRVLLEGKDACCETAWSPNGDRILYMLSVVRPGEPAWGRFDSQVWTVAPDGSDPIKVFDWASCDATNIDALPVWAPDGTQVAYDRCGSWVVENADGTGDLHPVDELVWRSWYSGGLSQRDLAGIGQVDH